MATAAILDLEEMESFFNGNGFSFIQATITLNFMKIGQLVQKLLQVIDFQDGDRRHLVLEKIEGSRKGLDFASRKQYASQIS
jgi:hypothetical protein